VTEGRKNSLIILSKFRRVWFHCADPGAFNAAEPLFEDALAAGSDCRWVFDGWCLAGKSSLPRSESLASFVERTGRAAPGEFHNECVLIGARTESHLSRPLSRLFKNAGFFTVFQLDAWNIYEPHFYCRETKELFLPDLIFIMDSLAAGDLVSALSPYVSRGEISSRIVITGQRGIERAAEKVRRLSPAAVGETRAALNPGNKHLLLMPLEPVRKDHGQDADGRPWLGYDEFTTLEFFFKNFDLRGRRIIIRPHPRHSPGEIKDFIARRLDTRGADWEVVEGFGLEPLIAAADELVGMTSTVLLTAMKCGKKVTSLQPGRNERGAAFSNPFFNACLYELPG
jgi:hypothetical protein